MHRNFLLWLLFVIVPSAFGHAQATPGILDPGAQQLYYQAQEFLHKHTVDDQRRGIELLLKAVAKDPKYIQAYIALADAYLNFPGWPHMPPKERYPKVKEYASRAIELDDRLAEGHRLVGVAEFNSWNWPQAETEFKSALQRAPEDAKVHASYGRYLAAMGRFEEAVKEADKALSLTPPPGEVDVPACEIYFWTRRYDRAIELLREVVKRNPNNGTAYALLGWAYAHTSKLPEAITAFEKASPLTERDAGVLMSLASAEAALGRTEESLKLVEEVKGRVAHMYVPVYRIAAYDALTGDKEDAFLWLNRAYGENASWMIWLKVDPDMDPLRSDPRFADLMQRMNFPPGNAPALSKSPKERL